jgi:DHA2 family multidrug resistance protein
MVMSAALFKTVNLDPQVDFFTVMMYRVYQSIGLAFLFIPITTIAYVGIPQEANNTVSGMINLARNIGASVGVSLVETMLARRTQFHQDRLAAHLTGYDSGLHAAARGLSATLLQHGLGRSESMHQAYARLYGAVLGQASMLAYIDAIWVMGVACAVMVPLAFLMARNDPRTAGMAVH